MIRMLQGVTLWTGIAMAGFAARGVSADGQQPPPSGAEVSDQGAARNDAPEQRQQPAGKPLAAPDYTKLTGFVEGAHLPVKEPAVQWNITSQFADAQGQMKQSGLTDAVVADGVLYFGDDHGRRNAVSIKDQSALWTHTQRSRISTTPSVDRDFVYFGSEAGITALQRETGKIVWQHGIPHGAGESAPVPVGDRVFASGYDGKAYCIDRATGAAVWIHNFMEDAPPDQPDFAGARARFQNIVARPNGSASDGKLFVQSVFDQSRIIALDCDTGKRRWTFQAGGWISPAPTIAGDRVYVASQDKHLYCLDRETGAVAWKFQTPGWNASRVAIQAGQVYLPYHGGRLYELAADSGKLVRTFEPPDEADRKGLVYSFPIIADRTAYFASGEGQLLAFDLESGKLRWKLRPAENAELFTSPATDGRLIFVTTRPAQNKNGVHAILAIGREE